MNHARIAGVDEAGRGAWAGNVLAAAVILPQEYDLPGLNDSKKLSPRSRERLFAGILAQATAVCHAQLPATEIDRLNIHHATLKAMRAAVLGLAVTPDRVLVDGAFLPDLPYPAQALVGGDGREAAIAAASIVAKVLRDRQMTALELCYPGYGFSAHKGYGTKRHLDALRRFGVLPCHRRSYAPIAAALAAGF